jgi:hypothetical protein
MRRSKNERKKVLERRDKEDQQKKKRINTGRQEKKKSVQKRDREENWAGPDLEEKEKKRWARKRKLKRNWAWAQFTWTPKAHCPICYGHPIQSKPKLKFKAQ